MRADATTAAEQGEAAQVMDALRRIVRALRTAERASETELGISAAQLFVLREIDKAGAPTVSELARHTATAQSSVSEVVARLVARRLVQRTVSPADRRRARIELTPAGDQVLLRASETVQERLLGAFARLDVERRRQLADALTDWVAESGLDTVAATMFFEPGRRADFPDEGAESCRPVSGNLPDSSVAERARSSNDARGLDRARLPATPPSSFRSPRRGSP